MGKIKISLATVEDEKDTDYFFLIDSHQQIHKPNKGVNQPFIIIKTLHMFRLARSHHQGLQ
jgi:hypothetical protein